MSGKWNQALADRFIPGYMQAGLRRWIEDGIPPGAFLCAVLQGDLKDAVMYADQNNETILHNYVTFLEHTAPTCWGSLDKFKAWYEKHLPRNPSQAV